MPEVGHDKLLTRSRVEELLADFFSPVPKDLVNALVERFGDEDRFGEGEPESVPPTKDYIGTLRLRGLRPAYLIGKVVPVIRENQKSWVCDVPDTAEFRTWAGRKGIRVPKGQSVFTPNEGLARKE